MPERDSHEGSTSGPQPGESPKARVDRELIELLNGLRVILPGVQVLLAFLLTVPFSSGFERTTRTEQVLYFVSVLITVGAVAALTAPAAYHRVRFREGDKERMLHTSNAFAIVGLVLLALAMGSVVFLVTNVIFGTGPAIPVAIVVLAVLGGSWFAVPLLRKIDETH
jgi:NADH:ubiquinone oxidoreductase subunit 6 (subunit J)